MADNIYDQKGIATDEEVDQARYAIDNGFMCGVAQTAQLSRILNRLQLSENKSAASECGNGEKGNKQ